MSGTPQSRVSIRMIRFALCSILALSSMASARGTPEDTVTSGVLRGVDVGGQMVELPLKHTSVRAHVSGSIARVELTQRFHNDSEYPIEAVYLFPLPNRAAIDAMHLETGKRRVEAIILPRKEADRRYRSAKRRGSLAALLSQQRPNVFTQSVANVRPGDEVKITLRYVEQLHYEAGDYQFVFPMVVGPRFIPGAPTGKSGSGWAFDTDLVPDASHLSPPALAPDERSGHDISLELELDAGTELHSLEFPTHQVDLERPSPDRVQLSLRTDDAIPNRDFVMRYRVEGDQPKVALVAHRMPDDADSRGYLLLLIQPEFQPPSHRVTPKEMVFVIDESASMGGFPIRKAKESMHYALERLNPQDRFQIIRFANEAERLSPEPLPVSEENLQRAKAYIDGLSASGGTILFRGIHAALSPPAEDSRLRIVSFMTDGYIGNENHILAYTQKHLAGARIFPFGIGSAVNRFLIDKLAQLGRGRPEYILLEDEAEKAMSRFYERIRYPYLVDIELEWEGPDSTESLEPLKPPKVDEVFPRQLPDLYLGQPLIVAARYDAPGSASVRLTGRLAGEAFEERFSFVLPDERDSSGAIPHLWARMKIEDLMDEALDEESPEPVAQIAQRVTDIALEYRLVSAYTSFLAVHEQEGSSEPPTLVPIPVPMPAGVRHDSVFGDSAGEESLPAAALNHRVAPSVAERARVIPPDRRRAGRNRPSRTRSETSRWQPRAFASVLASELRPTDSGYFRGQSFSFFVTLRNSSKRPVSVAEDSGPYSTFEIEFTDAEENVHRFFARALLSQQSFEVAPEDATRFKIHISRRAALNLAPGVYRVRLVRWERAKTLASPVVVIRVDPQ